jgi:diguanylate cyclase (GGDEF)-like protein
MSAATLAEPLALAVTTAGWAITAGYAHRQHHHAHTDTLTGLANRDALATLVARAARRRPATIGLVMVDIDRFKTINDTHGHAAGNQVLRALALRLVMIRRGGEYPIRLHGDELALWLGAVPAGSAGQRLAQIRATAIHDAVSAPISLAGHRLRVTVSTGPATLPTAGLTLPALLAAADHALYQAKQDTYRATGRHLPTPTSTAAASTGRLRDSRKDVA